MMPLRVSVSSRSCLPVTLLTVIVAVLVAGGAFLSRVGPSAAHQDEAVAVQVVDFAFEPGTLTVPAGATVTWTNAGSRPHTVTADDGSFDSGRLDPGEQFSQTFDQPGTFAYHCGFHPEMQGSIVVTEQAAESATTPEPQQVDEGIEATPAAGELASNQPAAVSDGAGPVQNLEPVEPSRLAHIHAGTC